MAVNLPIPGYDPNKFRKANTPAAPLPPPVNTPGAPQTVLPPGAPLPVPAPAPAPAVPVRRVAPLATQAVGAVPLPAGPPPPTLGVQATEQFETPQQRQARELQLRAANEAIATIEGRTPSVAQQQLYQGLDRAAAQQQSQAAGARGMGVSSARRMAARNIAELQQGVTGQAAELRAGEVAKARESLAAIAGQVRGQDLDTTVQGAAAIDRAKRNSNDYEVSMGDLELREKLGLLSDERERAHLGYLRESLAQERELRSRGLDIEADKVLAEMDKNNMQFWGGVLNNVGAIAGAAAGKR
jgi:hypothetical protein